MVGGQRTGKDGRRTTEDGGQRSEVGGQRSEDGKKKIRRSPRLNTLEGNPVQLGREGEKMRKGEDGGRETEVRDPQITPVPSPGATPVPSPGATPIKYAPVESLRVLLRSNSTR